MATKLFWLATMLSALSASSVNGLVPGSRRHPHVKFNDDCPSGVVAFEKFNHTTGVFDCAIKTATICYALCDMVNSNHWDVTNPVTLYDEVQRNGWYCRAIPGYPTKPCYFKPKKEVLRDVENMRRSQREYARHRSRRSATADRSRRSDLIYRRLTSSQLS